MASPLAIHIGMLDTDILDALSDFICGDERSRFPIYRSSCYLTRFFQNLNIDVAHDGSTRKVWVLAVLNQLQPSDIERVILRLVDPRVSWFAHFESQFSRMESECGIQS